jgi:ABC-type antimicrobial peptide transport system permease subunit
MTIIGVVGDVKHFGLDLPELPALYSPYPQADPWKRWMTFVARTQSGPESMKQAVKEQIWKADSQLPVTKVATMNEVAASSFAARRFNMLLLAIFAWLALVLAAVGIYGVMSYAVTQRTQEIGIRMALGASQRAVLGMLLREAMRLAAIGLAVGAIAALGLTRFLQSLLYGVLAGDPLILAGAAAFLWFTVTIACLAPALRAVRIDPMTALRCE